VIGAIACSCSYLLVPLAIGLGIGGLVQTSPERGQKGRWMAVTGICLALMWVVLFVVAIGSFTFSGAN
jgi:hypothetical protein